MKNKKKIIFINLLYLFIIIFPFVLLFKDFVDFRNILDVFSSRTFYILKNTVIQAFFSTILSLIISLIPAFYISKRKNTLSRFIESSIFIPFFFPTISTVIAFSIIFNFFKGLNISYTIWAILIAHSFYNSPIFVKYLGSSLKKIPKSIKEQAQIDGFSSFLIFIKVELPIIFPTIKRAFFLVFTYCFTSFAIVLSLGNIKYSTFEVAIIRLLHSDFDFSKALGYAGIQFFILLFINFIISNKKEDDLPLEDDFKEQQNRFVGFFSLIYILAEYSVVVISLFASMYNYFLNKFDFSGMIRIFSREFNEEFPIIQSIFNSLSVSFFVSIFVVAVVFILLKNRNKFSNLIVYSSMGISSAFLGMGLLYLNIIFDISLPFLAMLGYFLVSIPIAFTFMFQHVTGFNNSILEAGSLDGANSRILFTKIEFPILKPVFVSAFLQLFAIIYGEFTIVYTMQLGEYFPLASLINYRLYSQRLMQEGAAFSSLNIIIIFSIFYISKLIEKKSK